jgi:hypothetical protein
LQQGGLGSEGARSQAFAVVTLPDVTLAGRTLATREAVVVSAGPARIGQGLLKQTTMTLDFQRGRVWLTQ